MHSLQSLQLIYFIVCVLGALLLSPTSSLDANEPRQIAWLTDYHAGLDRAERRGSQVVLWFYDPSAKKENARLEHDVFGEPEIGELLTEQFVAVKLPRDGKITSGGEEITLLAHPAFAEMEHSAGLAIIDMVEPSGPLYRQVVSVYPFKRGPISAEQLMVLLQLPRTTLTQRTLIFAVRTHSESPASTEGDFSPILARETESHARHQASITLQGHHNWNARFHAINAHLPGGMAAREVCAESWPGQSLLDAAVECVHSWRQSPGHWSAVSSRHPLFAYDMQRGTNGVWYAAGIFANRAE
jgi:hypothetical protein